MGPELLTAMALAGGGAVVNNMAERHAAKDRRSILNQSMERTAQTNAKASDMVLSEAKKYSPDQRLADMQSQEAANFEQAQKDGIVPGVVSGASQGAGKVISLGDADKALAEGTRMTAIARELARVRAPNQLAANDSMRRANLAGETGSMWANDRAQANGASLDAQGVTAPWWGTLGKMGQAAGMAMTGNALMGAGGGALSAQTGTGPATTGQFSRMDRGQVQWR